MFNALKYKVLGTQKLCSRHKNKSFTEGITVAVAVAGGGGTLVVAVAGGV
jgi:hypothetical protein